MDAHASVPSQDIVDRVKKLRTTINRQRYLYHVKNQAELSEAALDSLKKELFDLEQSYPNLITPESPTQRVAGEPLPFFEKVAHKVPQWSFDDAFDLEDLEAFEKRANNYLKRKQQSFEYFCELKIDGLKVVLEYERGKLVVAATRGNGKVGENVTANVRTIESIPLELQKPVSGIFEGEIFLPKSEFDRINREQDAAGGERYANPRNMAAGTLRQLDPKIVADRKLDAFIYDIASLDSSHPPETQKEELAYLRTLGFKVNDQGKHCKNLQEAWAFYGQQANQKDRYDYLVDGLVLKIDDMSLQKRLGYTGKTPRFAIALKFPAEQKTTTVLDIHLSVGRTGTITPIALMNPVSIAGTTVSRASLHNAEGIERLDVRVGDTIVLEKAGDIIPKVIRVLKEMRPKSAKKFIFPEKIAACGGDGSIEKVPGQVAYRCVSRDGGDTMRKRLHHMVSKSAFDIDGLGPQLIDRLIDNELVAEPADLFSLKAGDLEVLEGFKEKSVHNLLAAIDTRRRIELWRFLVSLSIDGLGEETARLLQEEFGSLDAIRMADSSAFKAIDGIGSILAQELYDWFRTDANIRKIDDLLQHVELYAQRSESDGYFSGKTVVVTGSFDNYSRDEIKDIVRKQGGKVASAVSAKTDILLAGEKAGSKLTKARDLGLRIIDAAALARILG